GVTQTFDANVVDVSIVSGVYTFTDGTGATITSIDTNADAIAFDNTGSSLVSTDVQAALEELEDLIATNETTTNLVDNNDGTLTYSYEEGVTQTFDANVVDVTITSGVYTFTDGTGATITSIDTNAIGIASGSDRGSVVSVAVYVDLEE